MSGTIVCGIDGSQDSWAALEVASRLAKRLGSRLVLAHVARVAHIPYAAAFPIAGAAGPLAVMEEREVELEAGERLLEEVAVAAGLSDAPRRVEVG